MRLKNIIKEINDRLVEERKNDTLDWNNVTISYSYKKYEFFVKVHHDNDVYISVTSDDYGRSYPNIENYLYDHIFSWQEILEKADKNDEWDEHGFSDESDYINWKYGS